MELFSVDVDNVIKGLFITGRATYKYALDHLVNLIDQLDIQRKFQNENFYKRLEVDFQDGCITPAITLAFIQTTNFESIPSIKDIHKYILENIKHGFILDGIQRLNTLKRVANDPANTLDFAKHLYVNIIFCPSRDNLLYRMVTLNNGQKPMTARHQIEILVDSMYNFNDYSFNVFTEKDSLDRKYPGSFKKADILNGYISFLSNSTNLDNKKIIEDKLDELVARKIIESRITSDDIDFSKVLLLIDKLSKSEYIGSWLRTGNSLIGFCVGIRTSYNIVSSFSLDEFEDLLQNFETAFRNINVSKIKLSRERRRLSAYFIKNVDTLKSYDPDELTLTLADQL